MNPIQKAVIQKSCTAIALLGISSILSVIPLAVHAQTAPNPTSYTSPSSAFKLLLRGRDRWQRGDYKGAISDFNQAILFNPNDANIYFNRGFLLFQLGDQFGALSDFDQALLLNPRYAMAYFQRGGLRYTLGDQPGGIQDLQQAAKLFSQQGDTTSYQKTQNLLRQLRH